MHRWETRMLLKHYLERGVSKTELSRRFGVSRRTIHEWIETGQLDRDVSLGGARYTARPPMGHKLDPYKERDERGALRPLAGQPYRRLGVGWATAPARQKVPKTVEVERRSLRVYAEAVR